MNVVGIDVSPQAIKISKLRGLRIARVCSVDDVSRRLGVFDTILMLGNNFGLFGSFRRAKALLRRFDGMTSDSAWIIVECLDPYDTANPKHLAYQRRNKAKGRMAGQIKLRARYQDRATPWFDYLFVSRTEMAKIVDRTGWKIAKTLSGRGPTYIALIQKVTTGV